MVYEDTGFRISILDNQNEKEIPSKLGGCGCIGGRRV